LEVRQAVSSVPSKIADLLQLGNRRTIELAESAIHEPDDGFWPGFLLRPALRGANFLAVTGAMLRFVERCDYE
jgi:hypothetical protein